MQRQAVFTVRRCRWPRARGQQNITFMRKREIGLNADDGEGDGDAAPVTDNGQGGFAIATETEGGQLKVDRRRR